MSQDFKTRNEITESFERIGAVLDTGIFSANVESPLRRAAFTEVIICLNDLLQKSKNLANRISFQDDLSVINKDVTDITDTVSVIRNAVCHVPSKSTALNEISSTPFSFFGAGPISIGFPGGSTIESKYEDDVCFYVGPYRLYLTRHIIRAVIEVGEQLDDPLVLKPNYDKSLISRI